MSYSWGLKLKKLRKAMKLNQDEMAYKLGYKSKYAISSIESGSSEMSDQAKRCLEYLDVLYRKGYM